jgi:predicted transcriptional regulator
MANSYNKRNPRSAGYQYLILETVCSNEMMETFCNEDSIYSRLNPFEYNEEMIELEEQLRVEFWRVVNTLLTDRQRDVIKLRSDGLTQMEVAKKLGVNQSSVAKNLRGNANYAGGTPKNYGGSTKKIRKIIETDEKIQEILAKIARLREEKW